MATNGPDETPQAQDGDALPEHRPPDPDNLVVLDPETGQQFGTVTQFEYWRSGPLPTARELGDYDSVVPGLAGRIVERWESETDHRRDMERIAVTAGVDLQRNGQRYPAAIGLVAIVGGIVLTALGYSVVGLASILTPIAGIAVAFIWGQVRNR